MIVVREFVRSILLESRIDDVAKKYNVPRVDVDNMSMRDPSGRNKYLDWMIKQRKEHTVPASKIENIVRAFHERPQAFSRSDINQYDYYTLRAEALALVPSKRSERNDAKKGTKLVLSFDGLRLYRVDEQRSCQLYGAGTRWCVSSHGEGGFWNDYFGNTVLYMLIDSNAKRKYMIAAPLIDRIDRMGTVAEEKYVRDRLRVYDEDDTGYDELVTASLRAPSMLNANLKKSNITPQQNERIVDTIVNDFRNGESYKHKQKDVEMRSHAHAR